MKDVINNFVIIPKLRKEVEQVDFSFKKWWQSTQGENENGSVMT